MFGRICSKEEHFVIVENFENARGRAQFDETTGAPRVFEPENVHRF